MFPVQHSPPSLDPLKMHHCPACQKKMKLIQFKREHSVKAFVFLRVGNALMNGHEDEEEVHVRCPFS